jgi:hypothetical protein
MSIRTDIFDIHQYKTVKAYCEVEVEAVLRKSPSIKYFMV